MAEQYIEDRAGFAVVMERRFGGVEFDDSLRRAIFKNYSKLRHFNEAKTIGREDAKKPALPVALRDLRIRRFFATIVEA